MTVSANRPAVQPSPPLKGGCDANPSAMRLWIRRAPGHSRGLLTGGLEGREGEEASPDLQHHHARAGQSTRMVAFRRLHPSGDGKHRRLLEAGLRHSGRSLRVVVANAQHVKKVPGRKTDVKDAEWIAELLCHGLLRSSFVPPKPIRDLRDLMRYRRKLVESRAAERNRLLKLLETANIKLASVATDVFGVSGLLMLH